jgi:hypothetical protein
VVGALGSASKRTHDRHIGTEKVKAKDDGVLR